MLPPVVWCVYVMISISDSYNKAGGTVIKIVYVCMHVCDVSPICLLCLLL